MKNTTKTALCGIIAALSATLMLLSYFPYLTYAVPAVSGLFMMILVIEADLKWAMYGYFASAVLVLLLAETEAKLMYVFLFGFYPILKAALERIKKPIFEWITKFLVFNAAVFTVYAGASFVFGISFDDFGDLGKYGAYILLAAANVVFLLYDIAVSRMAALYMMRLHPQVERLLKRKQIKKDSRRK